VRKRNLTPSNFTSTFKATVTCGAAGYREKIGYREMTDYSDKIGCRETIGFRDKIGYRVHQMPSSLQTSNSSDLRPQRVCSVHDLVRTFTSLTGLQECVTPERGVCALYWRKPKGRTGNRSVDAKLFTLGISHQAHVTPPPVHTHTHTHARTHAHTHTYTHTRPPSLKK
jgi:hypothetical protein